MWHAFDAQAEKGVDVTNESCSGILAEAAVTFD